MGQPFPHFQNGQFPQGLSGALPQQGGLGQPPGLNPTQAAAMAQGMPGVDPRLMAQAQQQVANPDAGDALNILPGPKEAAIGAAGGVGAAYGLAALMGSNYDGPIPTVAKWLDSRKILNPLTEWARKHYQGFTHAGLKEGLLTTASSVPVGEVGWEKYAQDAVSQMEKRHIETVMEKFPNRFDDNLRKAYQGDYLASQKDKIIDAYNQHVEENFKSKAKGLTADSASYTDDLAKLKSVRDTKLLNKTDDFFNFAQKDASWLKQSKNLNFETTLNQAKAQVHYLENVKDKLSPSEKKILERLRGVKERISGLRTYYKPTYEAQAKLTAKLAADGVGPVGRLMALSGQYLQRIFNGETMGAGSKFFSGALVGPMLAGGFIFGMSAQKAKNAKEGEKTKTFFHDFFGTGIANFVGWELGRKWLNSTGIVHKVLGKFGTKRPFDNAIGKWVPFFGESAGKGAQKLFGGNSGFAKAMGTVFGKGLGGFFARLTLGGLATELLAMFAIGAAFQFVGEKIAHVIFGKPSQESIDGKGNKKPQPQAGNPQMAQQAGQGYPAQAYNPAMAGTQPMQQAAFNGQAMMPRQPVAPQQPQARSMPAFSLNPAQISDSTARKGMQSLESQIMNDHAQQQTKVSGRVNYFDPNTF